MALEAGVLDGIAAEKGEKVTAEDLAKSTGYDALLIGIYGSALRLLDRC